MRKSASDTPLSSYEHAIASERHARTAIRLRPASREWASVAYFYAAYHLVKQAILDDPIWHCPDELTARLPELRPSAAKVTRHHGQQARRRRGRSWGVNQLVEVLYPSIYRDYTTMHEASIQVRYLRRLQVSDQACAEAWARIRAEFRAGRMRAG